jgi:hypothetical protein
MGWKKRASNNSKPTIYNFQLLTPTFLYSLNVNLSKDVILVCINDFSS